MKKDKKLKKGFIHVYTGNGKGKTTAALGLALRAAGAGLKVYIGQFLKTGNYSEIKSLKRFKRHIVVKQFGTIRFIGKKITQEDKECARQGLRAIKTIIEKNQYDLVIIDEINVAIKYGLTDVNDVINLLQNKPSDVEIVLTGRYAHEAITNIADLVTEMKEIKHYYKKGIKSRVGIEK